MDEGLRWLVSTEKMGRRYLLPAVRPLADESPLLQFNSGIGPLVRTEMLLSKSNSEDNRLISLLRSAEFSIRPLYGNGYRATREN